MSVYVGKVGSCCNNYNVQNNMFVGPYASQDVNASILQPRIKPYSGWASYKNNKSGQFNRQLCWKCSDFKGYPQAAGVYPLNIVDTPPLIPNYKVQEIADKNYQIYQAERMKNDPGSYGTNHVNYLNTTCGKVYPKQYVKGHWPDEQLLYTNTPKNGCNAVRAGTPVCN